ncbi:MAG TPA: flagellar hook capping FlgD N-terminal domain-containing protein, partial [Desulfomonilia bacterium]|nr:flagellar hook capping FlgD N-terminal domain-containing protein [Desulfomonilia bacterium]
DNILANQSAAAAAASVASASATSASSEKDMFLNLLVKQLQYQDPLNPMENTEFASQLAQFSSLEALTSMKDSVDKLSQVQGTMSNTQALSFIGKKVSANGNTIQFTGSSSTLNFNLSDKASQVQVTIYNSSGTAVRAFNATGVQSGDIQCTWDGKDDKGQALAAGKYYFTVSAKGYDGNAVNATTYATGTVTGVRFDGGNVYLEIGDKEVNLADVSKISG